MNKKFITKQFNKPVFVCELKNEDCTFALKKGGCGLFPDLEQARECEKLIKAETTRVNKEHRGGMTRKEIKNMTPDMFPDYKG